jgi:Pseudouridylate synthases, 23S RNA-specific
MIHNFQCSIEGITLPGKFTYPFCYTPHPLCVMAVEEVQHYLEAQSQWYEAFAEGKMFGVLVVRTVGGDICYLAAYSGNIANSNKHDFFVPPVFDLLNPEGFFIPEEQRISQINDDIEDVLKSSDYLNLQKRLVAFKVLSERNIEEFRSKMKSAKAERDKRRKSNPDEHELIEMTRESQFLKAEQKRLERGLQEQKNLLLKSLNVFENRISALTEERKTRSFALQRRLFDSFRVLNAKGEERSLYDIFEEYEGKLPPAGAGECAAPKLLQYAYRNNLHPIAMAEFWWEPDLSQIDCLNLRLCNDEPLHNFIAMSETKMQSHESAVGNGLRRHGCFYPACKGKCEPILSFMLQGLDVENSSLNEYINNNSSFEVIFEDEWLVVVNKPAGMLSVPGKSNCDSVYSIIRQRYPDASGPLIVHRLDMDTSGLMIIAKTKDIHKAMQKLFAMGEVEKCYVAILDGMVVNTNETSVISLPLCLDPDNRPRQIVNYEHGKHAITRYEILERKDGYTKVLFYPKTGRTHQLRVHAAHSDGLNTPIKGDRLYGKPSDRLYLHAKSVKFVHPVSGKEIYIERSPDF